MNLDHDAIALADTFTELPEIEVKAERVAAHATVWTMPCLWVTADDFSAVDAAFTADSSIATIVEETAYEDEKYYQIDWDDEVESRINAYLDSRASMLNALASADGWRVRIRFVTRDQFDQFRETLREQGHSFQLLSLGKEDELRQPVTELTPTQREAIEAARKHGYYKQPREVSLRELADILDTSHQNLSNVLRQATEKLIDESIVTANAIDDAE